LGLLEGGAYESSGDEFSLLDWSWQELCGKVCGRVPVEGGDGQQARALVHLHPALPTHGDGGHLQAEGAGLDIRAPRECDQVLNISLHR
jgi:hypothetical protein